LRFNYRIDFKGFGHADGAALVDRGLQQLGFALGACVACEGFARDSPVRFGS
jgi:hypothetical protein